MKQDETATTIILIDNNISFPILVSSEDKNLQLFMLKIRERQFMRRIEEFEQLNLSYKLLRGIYSNGYEKPSNIQKSCIMPLIRRNPVSDLVCRSVSGSGKTGALSIGLLDSVESYLHCYTKGAPLALVILPTRELAVGTSRLIENLGEFLSIKPYSLVGGFKIQDDIRTLQNETIHIVIGSPGRVWNIIERGVLNVTKLKILILDEADEILDRGFQEELTKIMERARRLDLQTCLFSSTLSPLVEEFIEKEMREWPIRIIE